MSVLVDTSVWSLLYRKKAPTRHPKVHILTRLLSRIEDVTITSTILQEILQAFRSDTQFEKVSRFFEPFETLQLNRDDYITAARLHRHCASQGVTASTVERQIAISAIRHECLLLTADNDFDDIAKHCELKLL